MSCLPFLVRPASGPSICLVVKVKYEDTLRRFNIYIREDDRPDISFNALRSKICSLFQFNLNWDIIITYRDEDNDIINMVDEDDLVDAVRQRLNPLRLEISFIGLNARRQGQNAMKFSSQTSSLKTNAIPKGDTHANNGTTPTLKEQENGPSASPISRGVCRRTTSPSKTTFGVLCHGCGMNPIECACYASRMLDIHKLGSVYGEKLFDTSSSGEMENRSPGKLDFRLVKDYTSCSGAQILAPGTHFTKIWRLHNTGTLPWPQHTQLVKCVGSDFGAGNEVKLEILEQGFPVDEDFDAVLHFIAPMHPGRYFSYWRLMAPSGPKFGQQLWVAIQVVEFSKEVVIPLPLKSGSFQGKRKQRLFGEDVSFDERVSPYPMKSVQTTKDTDGNGMDISLKDSDENAGLSSLNMNFNVPVIIPDGASIDQHPGEKASGLTVQDSDDTIQLQGVSIDTASASDPLLAAAGSKCYSNLLKFATARDRIKFATARDPILAAAFECDSNLLKIATESDPSLETAEWDPILEELEEMGFYDLEKEQKIARLGANGVVLDQLREVD